MKYILATKQEMTQYFDEEGRVYPATLLIAGPIIVTQLKNKEKDGYSAVQVGFGENKKANKALSGHAKGKEAPRFMKEYRITKEGEETPKEGDTYNVSVFQEGDVVRVAGISKGRGFQGVVKRHGFHGGPRSHGQKHSEREPGSIGATGPQRVFKGTRMGGRMGGERVTVKNLKVLAIDKKNNIMLVSGAVPGRRGTLIEVSSK
jgi:large subunit ribosomal protein L3